MIVGLFECSEDLAIEGVCDTGPSPEPVTGPNHTAWATVMYGP